MPRIRLARNLVPLLIELDEAFSKYLAQTRELAEPGIDQTRVLDVAADRVSQKSQIQRIAWRINRVSRGEA